MLQLYLGCELCNIIIRLDRQIVENCYKRLVCPSVLLEQLVSDWTDFHETWYLHTFFPRKRVGKIQVLLKPDKNKGRITRRPGHRHWYYLATFFSDREMFQGDKMELQRKCTRILYPINYFRKSCLVGNNLEIDESNGTQMTI